MGRIVLVPRLHSGDHPVQRLQEVLPGNLSILGHSQDLAAVMPIIWRLRPPYWKAIDPDEASAKACLDLGVRLIVRHYGPWDGGDPLIVTPDDFTSEVARQPWFPYAWAVETPNEPHRECADWLSEVVHQLHVLGKETIVGNWGTGWDGYVVEGAQFYGFHEYGWPTPLSQAPWHGLRHLSWVPNILAGNPAAQFFLTEYGVTQAVQPGQNDVGWYTGELSTESYHEAILEYLKVVDPHVVAAFLYQVGAFPDWDTFESKELFNVDP